jgi:hypothetical protein
MANETKRYIVIHGSVSLPGKRDPSMPNLVPEPISVGVGGAVDLTDKQAAELVANGTLADEKKFAALQKTIAAAEESETVLPKALRKLAAGLKKGK